MTENRQDNPKKSPSKSSKIIGIIVFILINIAVIAWTATSEFGDSGDAADLGEVHLKWWMLIPALTSFIIAIVAEIYKYYVVMRDTHDSAKDGTFDKKQSWKIAKNTVLLGRYYDNITPAAVGGQPFQIFYMNKSGVKHGYGTAIPLIGMISDQLGYLIIGSIFIVLGSFAGWIQNTAIVAAGWFGLLCYAIFPIILLAATFLPNTTEEILSIIIKFLGSIHAIKHPKDAKEKAMKAVNQYATCIKKILRTRGLFLKTLLLGGLYYIGLTAIPFFVLQAFGANIDFLTSFATTAAVSAAVYFVPTPGNAGAAEGTFYSVFSILPDTGYVFWAMMVWRFFVYYSFLAIGLVTQLQVATENKALFDSWKKSQNTSPKS